MRRKQVVKAIVAWINENRVGLSVSEWSLVELASALKLKRSAGHISVQRAKQALEQALEFIHLHCAIACPGRDGFRRALETVPLETLTYSFIREHLAEIMDRVNRDRAPILVTRQNAESVVLLSAAEFAALAETAYLLRSPKNARRLLEAIEELRTSRGTPRTLLGD